MNQLLQMLFTSNTDDQKLAYLNFLQSILVSLFNLPSHLIPDPAA